MDALLDPIRDVVEGQIDFEGQQVAEVLSTALLAMTSAAALITGYMAQDIYLTLWVGLVGTFLTALIVVPPWPVFNQSPEPWLSSGKTPAGMPMGGIVIEQAKDR